MRAWAIKPCDARHSRRNRTRRSLLNQPVEAPADDQRGLANASSDRPCKLVVPHEATETASRPRPTLVVRSRLTGGQQGTGEIGPVRR